MRSGGYSARRLPQPDWSSAVRREWSRLHADRRFSSAWMRASGHPSRRHSATGFRWSTSVAGPPHHSQRGCAARCSARRRSQSVPPMRDQLDGRPASASMRWRAQRPRYTAFPGQRGNEQPKSMGSARLRSMRASCREAGGRGIPSGDDLKRGVPTPAPLTLPPTPNPLARQEAGRLHDAALLAPAELTRELRWPTHPDTCHGRLAITRRFRCCGPGKGKDWTRQSG